MSGTTDPGDRSSAEIERDVENTRARLTGTLEELRDRASPGQVFEQAVDYFRGSGGADFVRNLGQSVRDNPLPILLIGAGVGWLMLSGRRPAGQSTQYRRSLPSAYGRERFPDGETEFYGETSTYERTAGTSGASMTERASATMGEAKDRIGEAASGLRDSVAGAASRAGDMARDAGDMAGSAYRRAADAAGSAVGSIGSAAASARHGMEAAGHGLASAGQEAREQFGYLSDSTRQGLGWMMREQPLVLGAVGLAIGAAVGALLPETEAEDRLMGRTRDQLAERAKATAQEGYERVKESAGEHLEHAKAAAGEAVGQAKERLDHSGVSVGRAGEALGDAAKEVRQTVRDVAHDLAGDAKSAIGAGDDSQGRADGRTEQPKRPEGPTTGPTPNPVRPGPV